MSPSIVITNAASATLNIAPIYRDWIISGEPEGSNKLLAVSRDRTSRTMAWECQPGTFNWHYSEDETVYLITGEVFVTQDGTERRMAAGDIAFFPAGTSCVWRVTQPTRKVAFLRKDLPRWLGFGIRVWNVLLRKTGMRRDAPL